MVNLSTNVVENIRVQEGKFFTKWRINLEAITRMLKIIWRSGGSFDIRDLGTNTFMLFFYDKDDPKHILMQGPWSFDKYNGLFHLGEAAIVEDTRFDTRSFWVQICGLQIRCLKCKNAEVIGSTLGKVEYIEESTKGDCRGCCMRIQINIDITQPLCKGRLVNMGGPKPQWISFKYKCMPIFCYWCGVMNHDQKERSYG